MQILNEKTGVIYGTRTFKERNYFVSVVYRLIPYKFITSVSREHHPTRSKAASYAQQMCRSVAANHAYIN